MRTFIAAFALAFAVPAAHAQFDIGRIIDTAKKLGDSATTASKEFTTTDEVNLGEGIAKAFTVSESSTPKDHGRSARSLCVAIQRPTRFT